MVVDKEREFEVKISLTQNQATAILKFLDRAHFDIFLSLSEGRNEKEAYEMRNAFNSIAASIIADIPPSDNRQYKGGGGGTGSGG